jgi:hypothetical protein
LSRSIDSVTSFRGAEFTRPPGRKRRIPRSGDHPALSTVRELGLDFEATQDRAPLIEFVAPKSSML